ncbi:YegS/Rv2252/BmrU family lipid kinase [[Limnothrix rosea] IAM M-220]|uniref:YegS/Rv2252/BmrU family lipid kinase n=1 Tax=[Limnothrix rosea] IAM M-220 TaxID=454133 RepID=UPI00095D87D6|nr:YegS/Rv2252/BmrU family lipid kinase [[Limnothrix rosea] IAM M-220]OKH17778.1 hypothetical protein NIES208_08125 [[Limnothrix rosea] IAM M-220]
MKKVCLVFNPVSGSGNAPQDLEKIRAQLIDHVALDIRFTAQDKSAAAITEEAIREGAELVIAAGGDGTVSQVASLLTNTDVPMAVIPRGTANAFAAALNLPTDISKACDVVLSGQPQKIDGATCQGDFMTLLAGIGLEAATIDQTDRETKQKFGVLAYLATAVKQLKQLQSFSASLDCGDRQAEYKNVLAITVANLAPSTSILAQGTKTVSGKDGLLDVTILTMPAADDPVLGVLSASYELFQSALQDNEAQHPAVTSLRTPTVTIQTDPPQQLVLDGEMKGKTPVFFEAIPDSLWVQMPA